MSKKKQQKQPMDAHKRKVLEHTLLEFYFYSEQEMPIFIQNAYTLIDCGDKKIKNKLVIFLANNTINHIIDRLLIEICEAVKLLNLLFDELGEPLIQHDANQLNCDKDFGDLFTLRNKLLAHKMEQLDKIPVYKRWFETNFKHHRKILDLAEKASRRVCELIDKTFEKHNINPGGCVGINVPALSKEDVNKLIDALKSAGIY